MSADGPFADEGDHRCDNCGEIYDANDLQAIVDFGQRVAAGGIMPSGECPAEDCGALCFPLMDTGEKSESKSMSKEAQDYLAGLLAFSWVQEREDFAESGRHKDHIFRRILELDNWLYGNNRTIEEVMGDTDDPDTD